MYTCKKKLLHKLVFWIFTNIRNKEQDNKNHIEQDKFIMILKEFLSSY